ncbi:hypothetical protein INS49_010271 [Diaporthe citri]|uniref:uncharacterized protein n=1 Tax=Diaporthe citri TaxID=83186 RepID=UPI001C7FED5D|nr:uncharacterized protein INS49_010271 [Diaporthe citri]KAG6362042.1 hypothetical protein INS49_010271 [Diaporthe citri]
MASEAALADPAVAGEAVDETPEPPTYRLPDRPASSSVPDDPWTTYKPIIERLYIEEKKPLREVMQVMEREHGFRSTAKSYKRRLKAWGLTKYIKLQADHDEPVVREAFPDGTRASATRQQHGYVQLTNGRLVDAKSLAMHLKRKARIRNASQWKRRYEVLSPGAVVCAPDRFRVLEGVYANVRAYMMGRFEESITTPKEVDIARGWDPHSGRWLRFSAAVQAACEEGKMDDAYVYAIAVHDLSIGDHDIVWMRHAPEELGLLLRHQPSNTLNNFFRFLAQSIRFIEPQDPAGAQFLKVVKALIKFGVAYLAQNAAFLNLSTGHPLYRLFDCLARVDDDELLQAAWNGWKVGCQSWYDIMKDPAAWSANVDYLNIASLGGCSVSELPTNMGAILDKTSKRYEAEGRQSPKYLASLWNKAVYEEMIASNFARDPRPKSDTLVTCNTAHLRGLAADARATAPEAPIGVINSSAPRRALDRCIESMKQTVVAMEEEHGNSSPLVLQFMRQLEYGMYEIGEMEVAAEMASLLELRSSPCDLHVSMALDQRMMGM